ncbi:hypothetical protein [Variovorax sp. V15]|uniref:DUF6950 family protein n=1 Tax=Variovorax sp. V15 TaxID=3065952 RepID=UPI0034E8B130
MWGTNDCCTHAAAAVEAITGANPMAALEPYGTEAGPRRQALRRLLRKLDNAGGLQALVTAHMGEPIQPVMATVGDVVLVRNEGRELLTVCNGVNAMGPGRDGMVALSMQDALVAWRI